MPINFKIFVLAMSNVASDILKNSRAKESEKKMTSIKKIINLIP